MTTPTYEVTARWVMSLILGRHYWALKFTEPCACDGKTLHKHGGGDDPERPSYGTRFAHCRKSDAGMYRLVPAAGQPEGVD